MPASAYKTLGRAPEHLGRGHGSPEPGRGSIASPAIVRALGVRSVAVSPCCIPTLNDKHEREIGAYLQSALCPAWRSPLSADLARKVKRFEREERRPSPRRCLRQAIGWPITCASSNRAWFTIRCSAACRCAVVVLQRRFHVSKVGRPFPIFLLESGAAAGIQSALNTARAQDPSVRVLAFVHGRHFYRQGLRGGRGEPPVAHSFQVRPRTSLQALRLGAALF